MVDLLYVISISIDMNTSWLIPITPPGP